MKKKKVFKRIISSAVSCCFLYNFGIYSKAVENETIESPQEETVIVEVNNATERGISELFTAAAQYVDEGNPAGSPADNTLQVSVLNKSVLVKLVTKIAKNSTVSAASLSAIVHLIKPGKETWGIGIGIAIAGLDAAASIYQRYTEIMASKI